MTGAAAENGDRHLLLHRRDSRHARVTNEELFFDLVYIFAVTQSAMGCCTI